MQYPSKPGGVSVYSVKEACLIIGITSLAIFILNILALILTAQPGSVEWRIDFLEQLGNRSIAPLFGFALLIYSISDSYALRKWLAFVCLMSGILFHMGCFLVIHDTLVVQRQASANIAQQAKQFRSQVEAGQISIDDGMETGQAVERIAVTEQALSEQAKSDLTRAGIVSVGNLLIPGLGLIGLGRLGLRIR